MSYTDSQSIPIFAQMTEASGSTSNLNAAPASIKFASSFNAADVNIKSVVVMTGSLAGTAANIKLLVALQTDNGGVPSGVDLASYEQIGGFTSGKPTAIPVQWSGINLIRNNKYWIVISNTSDNPTTNYLSIGHTRPFNVLKESGLYGYIRRQYNGTDWTTTGTALGYTFIAVEYSSGAVHGAFAYSGTGISDNDSANRIYQNNAAGFEIQIPTTYPAMNIVGFTTGFNKTGTIGTYYLDVYRNRSLVTTLQQVNMTLWSTGIYPRHLLDNPLVAYSGDIISVMQRASDGDSSSNYLFQYVHGSADIPALRAMAPAGWGKVKRNSAGVWSTEPHNWPIGNVLLDFKNPFPSSINRRQYYAQR